MKKTNTVIASCLAAAVLFSACGTAPADETTVASAQQTTQVLGETRATEQVAIPSDSSAAPSSSDASAAAGVSAGTPCDLLEFCANHTCEALGNRCYMRRDTDFCGILFIYADGTFFFYTSDTGEQPYKATTGTFSSVEEVSDNVYRLTIGAVNQDHATGETWTEARPQDFITEESSFVASEIDFLSENSVLTVYDNGANKSEVPVEMLQEVASWTGAGSVEALPDQIQINFPSIGVYSEATGAYLM